MASKSKAVRDIEPGLRAMATRIVHAEKDFIELLMKFGAITKSEAEKVYAIYQKAKVIKLDAVNGTIRVTDGVYLDKDVIQEAVANWAAYEQRRRKSRKHG